MKFGKMSLGHRGGIVSPRRPLVEKLHTVLASEIIREGPDRDWLELLYLYRNKLAHLGDPSFFTFEFCDKHGDFFSFLPNHWPFIFQQHLKPGGSPEAQNIGTIKEFAEKSLIHQDLVEYSGRVVERTKRILQSAFTVLCEAYETLRDLEPQTEALGSLRAKSESYQFRYLD